MILINASTPSIYYKSFFHEKKNVSMHFLVLLGDFKIMQYILYEAKW